MYYPYFRGKQFELLAIRETAELLARANFTPIIEPVKEALKGLGRALGAVCEHEGSAIVIVNPYHGDLAGNGGPITEFLNEGFLENEKISAGILLTEEISVEDALDLHETHAGHQPVFIHAGFINAQGLAEELGELLPESRHVFLAKDCSTLYRKKFAAGERVLIKNGFSRMRNADYKEVERFSELHLTFQSELGLQGFGDFLMVGDEFSESGGPAYAVAIHMPFIDPEQEDEMFIYHFISDTNNTPVDPAGKFKEALDKLVERFETGTSKLHNGSAMQEFLRLHEAKHFPGLGQVKKLSMIHHIETLASYFSEEE